MVKMAQDCRNYDKISEVTVGGAGDILNDSVKVMMNFVDRETMAELEHDMHAISHATHQVIENTVAEWMDEYSISGMLRIACMTIAHGIVGMDMVFTFLANEHERNIEKAIGRKE